MGGEETVEQVRHRRPGERRAIPPGERTVLAAAPRRVLPLGAGGQTASGRGAERGRVVPAHLGRRMLLCRRRVIRPPGPAPGRAVNPDEPGRGGDDPRVGRFGPGRVEDEGPAEALGVGFVRGLRRERREARRGDFLPVEEEGGERVAPRNPDGARRRRRAGAGRERQQWNEDRPAGEPQNPNTTRSWGRNSFMPSTANLLSQTWSSVPTSTRRSAPHIAFPMS